MSGKIMDGIVEIPCPNPCCDQQLGYYDVHSSLYGNVSSDVYQVEAVVDRATFEKFETFSLMSAIRSDPNIRWCPRIRCGMIIGTLCKLANSSCT